MNTHSFEERNKIAIGELPREVRPTGYAVNHIIQWIIEHDKENINPSSASGVEEFRKEITEYFKQAVEKGRSGPLLLLNPAEYYAWCLKQELKQ